MVPWRIAILFMKKQTLIFINCLVIAFAIVTGARAQEPPPVPPPDDNAFLGFERDPFQDNPSAAQPEAPQQELTLELRNEPDGIYVSFTDFLNVLRSIDAGAHGEWDGVLGMFRITAAGRSMQALANQPVLVIDGRYRAVSKPLRVRGSLVLVPIESVKLLLKSLNFEFEIEGEAPTPTPAPLGSPVSPAPTPGAGAPQGNATSPQATAAAPSVPMSIVPPRTQDSMTGGSGAPAFTSGGPLVSPLINQSLPPLEAPNTGGTVMGLTWGQLADSRHTQPPRRLTLVCDAALQPVAERIYGLVARALGLDVSIVPVIAGRDHPLLVGELTRTRPDMVVDLMLGPSLPDAADAAAASTAQIGFEVWAVHEALWPAEARATPGSARSVQQMFRMHQFQNLALGAMLRGELSRGFPERNVHYSLMPAYLLRRADAPSAAVLLPAAILNDETGDLDRASRAIAGGIVAYCRGMESATRR
jgi:hypothetical protein